MPPSFEAPHLVLVITAFTGPLQVKRRRRILRIGSLRPPSCEIVRQAVDPGLRMIVGLADEIKTTVPEYVTGLFAIHFLGHCALLLKARLLTGGRLRNDKRAQA